MAGFDFTWSSEWTNTGKPWDYNRPLHRINSPSFDVRETDDVVPGGDGYGAGCRHPSQAERDFLDHLIRLLGDTRRVITIAPAWVPVGRNGYDPNFEENEKEVEGVLWQSFQTWTDVPLHQWHIWYDWNFHLVPARGYKYLRGRGNEHHGESGIPEGSLSVNPPRGAGIETTIECEWDAGAFGTDINDAHPGPMFDSTFGATVDPQFDWAWPQSGQYVWTAGRWIYDCGHEHAGMMRSELHPCKAAASARWEAVKFDENEKYVPAIQFVFFASRFGGYWDVPTITDRDYEFIVDLPKIEAAARAWDIGHTPDFPLNTVVLSPRLLHKFDSDPFAAARGEVKGKDDLEPILEPIPGADPTKTPEQIKVKIPLTQLQGQQVDAYGVIVSLGWFDPDGSQARKVRKIRVEFPKVHKAAVNHDVFAEEWRLRIGVNGRWFSRNRNQVHNNRDIGLGKAAEFLLSEDDFVTITAHGTEENLVGDFMKRAEGNRTLDLDGEVVNWAQHVDQPDDRLADRVRRRARNMMAGTLEDQNEPLGVIPARIAKTAADPPDWQARMDADESNPARSWRVKVADLVERLGDRPGKVDGMLTGLYTFEIGATAELAFNPARVDYTLHYTIHVDNQ